MSIYGFLEMDRADVPTPAAGEFFEFIDIANGHKTRKDSAGNFTDLDAVASGVTSFEGRSGAVTAADGDYAASEVVNVPYGTITNNRVQGAINHLEDNKAPLTHVGSTGVSEHGIATGSVAGFMSPTDKSKLDGIASGATANDTDANLKNRANHTGAQTASTISDFASAAKAAVVDDAIVDGVADKAPSQNAVFDALALKESLANKNQANGYAGLDGGGKIPTSLIPQAIKDQLHLLGTWNANTNSPALASGVGEKGGFYIVTTAGNTDLDGENDWNPKDWAFFDGTVWKKVDSTDQVTSVNGKQGVVVLNTDDVQETGTPTNKYYTDARARAGVVDDAIVDGVTNKAPSQNAVFDALETKLSDLLTSVGDMFFRNLSNVTDRLAIGDEDFIMRSVGGQPAWVEENLSQDFGGGQDGSINVTGLITLTQPTYYNVLAMKPGGVIVTNGYPLYCKKLDLTLADANSIRWNGNNGVSSTNQTGQTAGAALAGNMLGGSGAGSAGATGVVGAGAQAAAPATQSPSNGGAGGNGAAGGAGAAGANAGGAARTGGAISNFVLFDRFEYQFLRAALSILGGAGGAGGSSGGGDGTALGRGGGGGGSGGGVIVIYAYEIATGPSTPANVISSMGGNGGNGASATTGTGPGGGGAGGGAGGGYIYIAFVKKTGSAVTDLINANGGNGGNGGNGFGTGAGANGGNGGNGGRIRIFDAKNAVSFAAVVGTTGSTGSAASGLTGGLGGQGGVAKATI